MASRPTLRAKLRAAQEGRCCYCRVKMLPPRNTAKGNTHPKAETLEHLKRLAEGGTNAYDNMALSCFSCNTGRGSMDWLSYTTIRRNELHEMA